MKLTIRRKLVVAIVVPLLLLSAASLALNYPGMRAEAMAQMQAFLEKEAQFRAARFDGEFETIAQIARSTAAAMATHADLTEPELYEFVTGNLRQHPLVYGSCIAFEPFAFDPARRLVAPYAYRGPDAEPGAAPRTMDLSAEAYDYSTGEWEWYDAPRTSGKPGWTEPYFDEGAGDVVMCTYSVPIIRDGRFRGVVTVDVRLDSLEERVRSLETGGATIAILSARGTFLAWPEAGAIMNATIFDLAGEIGRPELAALGRRMVAGETGSDRLLGLEPGSAGATLISYAPIPSAGWSYGATVPEDLVMAPVLAELRARAAVAVGGVVLAIAVVLAVSWWLTRPIEQLAEAVRALGAGNLAVRVPQATSGDELADLSRAFNAMATQLGEHVTALTRETAARQAVESELNVAREIQTSLLPRTFPPYPHRDEFDLHAIAATARQVGGDFFDFWFLSEHELALVIADVSGKGVPAAMFMAVTRTLLRNLALGASSPGELLTRANSILYADNEHGMFVTVFVGYYDARSGRLRYANAGHPPPMVVRAGGEVRGFGGPTGTVLAAIEGERYADEEGRLDEGDRIVFYTDGVSEARSPSGAFFGVPALVSLLDCGRVLAMRPLCESVVREVTAFQRGDLADDVTVMALSRSAAGGSGTMPPTPRQSPEMP